MSQDVTVNRPNSMVTLKGRDIVFIDFDETLFNHEAFNVWFDERLMHEGLITKGAITTYMNEYHEIVSPILRRYRHEDHLKDATGKPWSYISGHVKAALKNEGCQFCYDDSHDFLRRALESCDDVRLLSFGVGEYQRFKMSLCRILQDLDLPIHIVDEPKSQFLIEQFSHISSAVLVDDKYPLCLPDNVSHILIDRKGSYVEVIKHDTSVRYVTSLNMIDA